MPQFDPARYMDVLPLLEAAQEYNGGRYKCNNAGDAKRLVHRCNECRRALRRADPDGLCPYDRFVIRAENEWVILASRTPFQSTNFEPLP